MSDVYAMGGRVLFALSIAAFPEELPRETMTAIFAGAAATVREAGGVCRRPHHQGSRTQVRSGVIGAVHPDRILRKGGANQATRSS
jgi:selenide,water dikinase